MAALPNPDLPTIPVLDELASAVVLLAPGGDVAYVNTAAAAFFGASVRRLIGRPWASLLVESSPDVEAAIAGAADARAPVHCRRLRFAASGADRFADVTATPLAGGVHAVALELKPVNEFRELDAAQALPAALQSALQGLAHEVKNPLAGLRGAAQLLKRRVVEPDAQRYLDVITAEADRLVALVDRLLDPTPARPPVPVNIHEVLERVRVLAESDAGWSVVIRRDYDPSLPDLTGDPDRLTQAIWNLVRNALQSGSSEVRLRTRAEHNVAIGDEPVRLAVRIEVIDDGQGVDEALGNRILLPLVSGRADGTGLGLPLAHAVAREHGGMLTFRSRPGHTVFSMLLPVGGAA